VLPRFAFGLRCLAATAALALAGLGATSSVQAATATDCSGCFAMVLGTGGLFHQRGVASSRRVNRGTFELVFKRPVTKCALTATIDNVTSAAGLPVGLASPVVERVSGTKVDVFITGEGAAQVDDSFSLVVTC
jgi:hypothetical protein